jgi:cytochrome c oxidase subunit II
MRRGSLVSLLAIGVVAGAIAAAVAVFVPWLPDADSNEAVRIHFVFWFTIVICIVIFAIVAAVLVYSVWKFRAAPDDDSDGPSIHGHTGLEIVWTLIPTILVTAIGIVSAIVLARNDAQGANVLHVDVTAQQFAWSFSYPDAGGATTGTLRLPKGRSVLLRFTSKDVIHSFWVPEFSQKQDTVPGLHPTLHITPNKTGTFDVICTELCGLGHATMRTTAVVMAPAAFDAWLHKQGNAQGSSNPAVSGAAIFSQNGCGSCHTLTAAKATGKVGPDLDNLKQYAQQAGQPLDQFIRDSITDPNKFVQPGFPKNVMPSFKDTITGAKLDALVQYLTQSSK